MNCLTDSHSLPCEPPKEGEESSNGFDLSMSSSVIKLHRTCGLLPKMVASPQEKETRKTKLTSSDVEL